jgi:hypothetical protein
MTKPDLTYLQQGMFTLLMPETDAGRVAWDEIARHTDGTGKVLTIHLKSALAQLRAAGYTVHKAKPNTMTIDSILKE